MGRSAAGEIRHVETRFIASHPLGAQPRHDILLAARPSSRPVRSAFHSTSGLEEAGLLVTAGGAKRNPRYEHIPQREPRRGVYPRSRHGHSDLFEADILTRHATSGCAALHPRLLIARPLRGRRASRPHVPAAQEIRHRRDAILASHRSGRSPAMAFSPPRWPSGR